MKARFFSRLIFTESRPRLQPAFGREIQAYWSGGPRFVGTIQVHRQHIADGSPLIFALLEAFHSSEHQQAAAAFRNISLQERGLIGGEKLRFQVIDNHRVIAIKIFGRGGKAGAQLKLITGIKPDQHRPIIVRTAMHDTMTDGHRADAKFVPQPSACDAHRGRHVRN